MYRKTARKGTGKVQGLLMVTLRAPPVHRAYTAAAQHHRVRASFVGVQQTIKLEFFSAKVTAIEKKHDK